MQTILLSFAESLVAGTIAAGLMLVLVKYWLMKIEKEREGLVRKIDNLSENRVTKIETAQTELEKRVTNHEKNDASKEILLGLQHLENDFKRMEGTIIKMDGKLDQLSSETARQEVKIDNNAKSVDQARSDLNHHKREGHKNA